MESLGVDSVKVFDLVGVSNSLCAVGIPKPAYTSDNEFFCYVVGDLARKVANVMYAVEDKLKPWYVRAMDKIYNRIK